MRGLVKTGAAGVLAWARADAVIGAVTGSRRVPLVLGYHRVVESFDDAARSAMSPSLTSARMLETQLDWVGRRFPFVTLDELGDRLARGDATPVAAVTFDDGYRDVYEQAFPRLRRKGIPAAVFVVTDALDTGRPHRHDVLYALLARAFARWPDAPDALGRRLQALALRPAAARVGPLPATAHAATSSLLRSLREPAIARLVEALESEVDLEPGAMDAMAPMTWAMAGEMKRAGFVVGSHTRSHAWLTLEPPAVVAEELRGARIAIERRLGGPVRHFAYPDGQFARDTTAAVDAAGYALAYTTCTHRDPEYPLLTLPRLMLWEKACLDTGARFSPAILSCQVHGVFDLVRGCEHAH
ncbi:MAG: polysaccharide deacetylase family protein [Candidatus Rokubacteria bacterium]|nr:polysaccharide deacetylase family protein [Candidatus Rokubacteria bacterium]